MIKVILKYVWEDVSAAVIKLAKWLAVWIPTGYLIAWIVN